MTLASKILTDPTNVFLNTDDFAESVTYKPYDHPGRSSRATRAINAVVERNNEEPWILHVHNNATTGITSTEIDLGNDEISFPRRDGESASSRVIKSIVDHDTGMLVLECE